MNLTITTYCSVTTNHIRVNGMTLFREENFITFAEFIKSFFKNLNLSYPKFYKMDQLSKLGFISAELVMSRTIIGLNHKDKIGVVLANSSSSLDIDRVHQESVRDRATYFPSPSVFVYTLPNIMIGEICIRHGIKGENAFLISEKFEPCLLLDYVNELFFSGRVEACLTGWVELLGNSYHSMMMMIEPEGKEKGNNLNLPFDNATVEEIFTNN
jgi:hypothetical protein